MSISPSETTGSDNPRARLPIHTNPKPSHGAVVYVHAPRGRGRRHGGASAASPPVTTGGGGGRSVSPDSSESTVLPTGDSVNATKKVVGFSIAGSGSGSYSQDVDNGNECQSLDQEGRASDSQLDPAGVIQANRERPAVVSSLNFDHPVSGPVGHHGSRIQAATRKNHTVNANHLLNFYYDPISRPQPRGPRPPPPRRQQKIKPYNKDLFLQANFKFVVLDTGSYGIESMDPDKMLQWEDIICVRYYNPTEVQCPICLESPLCPQITTCGHIYCFPCILRYLVMGKEDNKGECWKKCPLCFMMISTKELYTISITNVQQLHVGDSATFKLLSRPKNSLVPQLKNQYTGISGISNAEDEFASFSKFILTTDAELSVREAKTDLKSWLNKADSGLVDDLEKLPYVCAALEQLDERMKYWTECRDFGGSPPLKNNASPPSSFKNSSFPKGQNSPPHGYNAELDLAVPDGDISTEISVLSVSPESNKNSEKATLSDVEENRVDGNWNNIKDANERDSYTFYQVSDGQHLILHPLNMKCLLNHYGSYDILPPRITGRILELETVTQSEAMRKRYRYLSHFSLTTTFQLCELDLRDVLPPSSMSPFIEEIKKREKQRQRLAKKDKNERARAEVAALQESAIPFDPRYIAPHSNVMFSLDDFEALGSNAVPSSSPPSTGERKRFSDVARLGFAAAHDSPPLGVESVNSSGSTENTGNQGPTAITAASFAKILSTTRATESLEARNTNGIGKKGKKPTRVLLSTSGGGRRY